MSVFTNMPDELNWDVSKFPAKQKQLARERARMNAKPEDEQEPEQSLYAWRRPGVRTEQKRVGHCQRFAQR
jgi:hypothetical protein